MKNLDEIPPELAAQIVKAYILPMFESTGKKELKSKHNKILGIAGPNNGSRGSVYGELKLSEKLMEILNNVRDEVDSLKM